MCLVSKIIKKIVSRNVLLHEYVDEEMKTKLKKRKVQKNQTKDLKTGRKEKDTFRHKDKNSRQEYKKERREKLKSEYIKARIQMTTEMMAEHKSTEWQKFALGIFQLFQRTFFNIASSISEDAGIEPRTVATLTLSVQNRRSNHSPR